MRAVGTSLDHEAAASADAFAAIVIEGDRFFAFGHQILVEDIQHLEKRRIRRDVAHGVGHEPAFGLPVLLSPDLEGEVHYL